MRFHWPLLPCLLLVLSPIAQAVQIKGTVVGPNDIPVPNAQVAIAPPLVNLFEAKTLPAPQQVRTDAAGQFSVEVEKPDADLMEAAEMRPYTENLGLARVTAPGYFMKEMTLKEGLNQIRLTKSAPLNGIVVDAESKPVAGATVFMSPNLSDREARLVASLPDFPRPQAITDAEGRFTFQDGPGTRPAYLMLEDPRSARVIASGKSSQEITLKMVPGAVITGLLQDEKGKPLANTTIVGNSNRSQDWCWTRTGADGTYKLFGFQPGDVTLRMVGKPELLAKPLQIQLTAGENTAPPWQAQTGVQVTGQLVSGPNKTPVSNLQVRLMNFPSTKTISDAQGRFKLRTLENHLSFSITDPKKLHVPFNKSMPIPAGSTTIDLGQLEIERGQVLNGVVQDENGQPIPRLAVSVRTTSQGNTGGNRRMNVSVKQGGEFTVGPLAGGTWQWYVDNGLYEVVSPTNTTIEPGKSVPNLTLKLRSRPARKITGLVLTPSGKPVSNAYIQFVATGKGDDNQETPHWVSATTDAEGRFESEPVAASRTVRAENLQREGHLWTGGQKVTEDGDKFVVSELVLTPLTARIEGQVLTSAGQATPGAIVHCMYGGVGSQMVAADNEGKFQLSNAPEGSVTILAAAGTGFVSWTGTPTGALTLKLQPRGEITAEQKRELISGPTTNAFRRLLNAWDMLGEEQIFKHALRADNAILADGTPDLPVAGAQTAAFLRELARRNPARAATWGREILSQIQPGKETFVTEAALAAAAPSGDDAAKEWARNWLKNSIESSSLIEYTPENVSRWFQLAGVAGALKEIDQAQLAHDAALTLAERSGQQTILTSSRSWGESLALGGTDLLDRLRDEWALSARYHAWAGAIPVLARSDMALGRQKLADLKAMREHPELKAILAEEAKPNQNPTFWRPTLNYSWNRAVLGIARELMKSDLAAAVDLVQTEGVTEEPLKISFLMAAARTAVASGQKELALKLLTVDIPGTKESHLLTNHRPNIDAMLIQLDAPEGEKRFKDQLPGVLPEDTQFRRSPYSTVASFAFYRAASNPAQSRILLEREWAIRMSNLAGSNNNQDYIKSMIPDLAVAMYAVDPARAYTIFKEAPEVWSTKDRARAKFVLLQALPASDYWRFSFGEEYE